MDLSCVIVAAHHSFFHIIDFLAALMLLSLAIIERPAVDSIDVPIVVSSSTFSLLLDICMAYVSKRLTFRYMFTMSCIV